MSHNKSTFRKWWPVLLLPAIIGIILGYISQWKWCWFAGLVLIFMAITIWLWEEIRESGKDADAISLKRYLSGDTTEIAWYLAVALILFSYLAIFKIWDHILLTKKCSYNYLLSSINQSLATLFALIFALMFTLTQLSRNKKNLEKYFTNYVLIYIVLFIVSILSPLFLMGTENQLIVQISLFFTSLNMILLIPFFWRFKIKANKANRDENIDCAVSHSIRQGNDQFQGTKVKKPKPGAKKRIK